MAAVDFFSAFQYKWAQTGTVFAWDDAQYKLGWATIGSTPPSVEQFNRAQQVLDEKSNWLYGQLHAAATAKGISLSAGDLNSLKTLLDAYTPAASEGFKGIVELATAPETQAGTDNTRAVTPAGLSARTATETRTGLMRIPTSAEARALTDDLMALTPKKLADILGVGSVSSAGYLPLPIMVGGVRRTLYIQWAPALSDGAGFVPILYPIAFPNAALVIVASPYISGDTPRDFSLTRLSSLSNANGANFAAYVGGVQSSIAGQIGADIIAIGW